MIRFPWGQSVIDGLQQERLNERALAGVPLPPAWRDMDELERVADRAIRDLREARRVEARRQGGFVRALDGLDRLVRTEAVEHLDDPGYPAPKKLEIVRALHGLNRALLSYRRFLAVLRSHIEDVSRREGRPARILELASGSGEFSLELARLAESERLPIEVTGSDVVERYLEEASRAARQRRLAVEFRYVNAFDMTSIEPRSYDLVFIAQSIHHFSPGQLAMMIAQSARVATTGFVGVDARRSLLLLTALPWMASLSFRPHFVHDALVTARRLYSDAELTLIAKIAAPGAHVRVRPDHPGYTVLTVAFGG